MSTDPLIHKLLDELSPAPSFKLIHFPSIADRLRYLKKKRELQTLVFGPNQHLLRFPTKLHKLASCSAISDYIFWLEGGDAIAIDRQGYQRHIMRTFFDQRKFKSFENCMSRYGFETVVADRDILVYHHPLFLKDQEALTAEIAMVNKEQQAKFSPDRTSHAKMEDKKMDTDVLTDKNTIYLEIRSTSTNCSSNMSYSDAGLSAFMSDDASNSSSSFEKQCDMVASFHGDSSQLCLSDWSA